MDVSIRRAAREHQVLQRPLWEHWQRRPQESVGVDTQKARGRCVGASQAVRDGDWTGGVRKDEQHSRTEERAGCTAEEGQGPREAIGQGGPSE